MRDADSTQTWPVMVVFDADALTSGVIDLPSLEVFVDPEESPQPETRQPRKHPRPARPRKLRGLGWG